MDDLLKGDLIEVHWVDIGEEPVSDPAEAELPVSINVGYFYERKTSRGVPVFVTTTNPKPDEQAGFCIYPEAVILKIKSIRRKRRTRKKKEVESEG